MSEKSRRGHQKKGTHGSLSKAGKSIALQPVNWVEHIRLTKDKKPHYHIKKHKSPRLSNRVRYNKMVKGKGGNKSR